MASKKLDEVDGHVFQTASRINSTWGGNLVDMVRFDRILEIIEEDHLVENAHDVGEHLKARLGELQDSYDEVTNVRGRGLMCAFDLNSVDIRDRIRKRAFHHGVIILGCGVSSLRFRPPLTIDNEAIDDGLDRLKKAIDDVLANRDLD